MTFKDDIKKAYDADAGRRKKADDSKEPWKKDARKGFTKLAKDANKKTLLELGSGTGEDALYFKKQGFDVTATDLSEKMVEKCKERGLNAKVVDLYHLESLKKTFDCIYSMNVLLHVPRKDLSRVLDLISDTLNTKGLFFYGVYANGKNVKKIITDKKKMGLPRFFSFLSDKTLLEYTKEMFEVVKFKRINIEANTEGFYFQSLTLRKKEINS